MLTTPPMTFMSNRDMTLREKKLLLAWNKNHQFRILIFTSRYFLLSSIWNLGVLVIFIRKFL